MNIIIPEQMLKDPKFQTIVALAMNGETALAIDRNPEKAADYFGKAIQELETLLGNVTLSPAWTNAISSWHTRLLNALARQSKFAQAEKPAKSAFKLAQQASAAEPTNLDFAINALKCLMALMDIHKKTNNTSEESEDRKQGVSVTRHLLALGEAFLNTFNVDDAYEAFRAAYWEGAEDMDASSALLGIQLVKALKNQGGGDPVWIPSADFEEKIMKRHFCIKCRTFTKTWRAKEQMKDSTGQVVDCWYAECPHCKQTGQIYFHVSS